MAGDGVPDLKAVDVSSQSSRSVTALRVALAEVGLIAIGLAGAQLPQQLFRATAGHVAVLADDDWSQLQQEQDERMAQDALQQSLQQMQQSEQAAEEQNEQAQQQALQAELQGQMVEQQAGQ
jgi:hypothetical protein